MMISSRFQAPSFLKPTSLFGGIRPGSFQNADSRRGGDDSAQIQSSLGKQVPK